VKNFKECANYFGIWMVFMFVERSFFQNTIVMHFKKNLQHRSLPGAAEGPPGD
jgi:hypothetical protein